MYEIVTKNIVKVYIRLNVHRKFIQTNMKHSKGKSIKYETQFVLKWWLVVTKGFFFSEVIWNTAESKANF